MAQTTAKSNSTPSSSAKISKSVTLSVRLVKDASWVFGASDSTGSECRSFLREYSAALTTWGRVARNLGLVVGGRDMRITVQKRVGAEIRSFLSQEIDPIEEPHRAVATVAIAVSCHPGTIRDCNC